MRAGGHLTPDGLILEFPLVNIIYILFKLITPIVGQVNSGMVHPTAGI